MWDLPGPGLEPVSPALAGGFLTTRSRQLLESSLLIQDLTEQLQRTERTNEGNLIMVMVTFWNIVYAVVMFYFYGYVRKPFLILRLSLVFNLVDSAFVNWNFKMVSDSVSPEFRNIYWVSLHFMAISKGIFTPVYQDIIEQIDCATKAIPGVS